MAATEALEADLIERVEQIVQRIEPLLREARELQAELSAQVNRATADHTA